MRQIHVQETTNKLADLIKLQWQLVQEAARLLGEIDACNAFDVEKRFNLAIAILRSETPKSFATKIDDSTFTFQVLGNPKLSQESHINAKLGADASFLIEDLKSIGVQLDQGKVPEHSKAVLSRKSNDKTYTKQKGFYPHGLASPYEAVNIAIEVVCAAKQVGVNLRNINSERMSYKAVRVRSEAITKGLDEGTVKVLSMLTEGDGIKFDNGSRSGALYVSDFGRLRARLYNDFSAYSYPSGWAFGASPSAE